MTNGICDVVDVCVMRCCGHKRCDCGERMRDPCGSADVVICPHCGRRYGKTEATGIRSYWSLPGMRASWQTMVLVEPPWNHPTEIGGHRVQVIIHGDPWAVTVGPFKRVFDTLTEARVFHSNVPRTITETWCVEAGMRSPESD